MVRRGLSVVLATFLTMTRPSSSWNATQTPVLQREKTRQWSAEKAAAWGKYVVRHKGNGTTLWRRSSRVQQARVQQARAHHARFQNFNMTAFREQVSRRNATKESTHWTWGAPADEAPREKPRRGPCRRARVQAKRRTHGTCAVVASSGALRHAGLGAVIDAHDAVLRFNDAPTEGFEVDVGSKTSYRLLNSICTKTARAGRVLSATGLCARLPAELTPAKRNNTVLISAQADLLRRCSDLWTRCLSYENFGFSTFRFRDYERRHCALHNSTVELSGTRGLLAALHLCNATALFGYTTHFDHHENGTLLPVNAPKKKTRYHYYDNQTMEFGPHNPSCDVLFLRDLLRQRRFRLCAVDPANPASHTCAFTELARPAPSDDDGDFVDQALGNLSESPPPRR